MNTNKAKQFIIANARPFELSLYRYFFEHGTKEAVMEEFKKFQNADGGFDISWEWGTDYPEFEQARSWWRPRITIDKLLFWQDMA